MKKYWMLNLICLSTLTGLSNTYGATRLAFNPDVSVSVQRDNLIQETLMIKNISGHKINTLSIQPLALSGNSLTHLQIKSAGSNSCLLVSKQNSLKPLQICTFRVINTEVGRKLTRSPAELTIIANGNNNPIKLKIDSGTNLYVGGIFNSIGGNKANYIASWDGQAWSALSDQNRNGTNDYVLGLAYDDNLQALVVGGYFTMVGSISAEHIARYWGAEGSSSIWDNLGGGVTGEDVNTVKYLSSTHDSMYYIGGSFNTANGQTANNIVKIDCADNKACSYYPLIDTAGNNGVDFIVKGISSSLSNPDQFKLSVVGISSNSKYANAAQYTLNSSTGQSAWNMLGNGINSSGYVLTSPDGNTLYVGGGFSRAGDIDANYLAKWNGTVWSDPFKFPGTFSSGMYQGIDTLLQYKNILYAGGNFKYDDTTSIAKWDGTNWSTLGQGLWSVMNVLCMVNDDDGNIYVGGDLLGANKQTPSQENIYSPGLIKWDGTEWSAMGTGTLGDENWVVISSMVFAPYLNITPES